MYVQERKIEMSQLSGQFQFQIGPIMQKVSN